MRKTSISRNITTVSANTRRAKRLAAAAIISAAASSLLTSGHYVAAATLTWSGSVADPNSASYAASNVTFAPEGYTNGANVYVWNTTVANWVGGSSYAVGDSVVFGDSFNGATFIRLPTAGMNPASMTFADTGSGFSIYNFLNNNELTGGATSSIPWNPPYTATLTLDTGFNGKVVLRNGGSSTGGTNSNTIIRSGILEVLLNNTIPSSGGNSLSNVTLAGGELRFSFALTAGSGEPASSQLGGTLTVSEDSILTGNSNNGGNSRVWGGGPINIASGKTLTIQSLFNSTVRTSANFSASLGTVKLQDTTGIQTRFQMESAGGASLTVDTGSGSSSFSASNTTTAVGALIGGVNTTLRAGGGNATFSIGGKNVDSTFNGQIGNGTIGGLTGAGILAITKVGTGNLFLNNLGTYSGQTTVSGGTLVLGSTAGSSVATGTVLINGGAALKLDNSTTSVDNRLNDVAPISLNTGRLEAALSRTSATNEAVGTLTLVSGSNTVQTTAIGASGNATLTFAGIARTGGVLNFDSAAGTNVNITGATNTNGILGAYATSNGDNWAALTGTLVGPYTHLVGETDTDPSLWTSGTDNINLTLGGTPTVAASRTINSLRLASTVNLGISASTGLTLVTGGILAPGTSNPTISGLGTITAGTGAATAELLVQVPNAANILTISASIADNAAGANGTVTLVKAGPGKLVLAKSTSFTGGISILGGTLSAGATNVLNGPLTVDFGNTFDLGGFSQSPTTVTLINGSIINTGGAAALSGASYGVQNGTVSANLAGTAALSKSTGSTVTLSGSNSYSGGTNVSAGTLLLGSANALPTGGNGTVTGGVLNIGAFNQNLGSMTFTGGTTTGTGSITATYLDVRGGTISTVLAGSVGVNKTTDGAATLNANNTYSGPTSISAQNTSSTAFGVLNITTIADGGVPSPLGASSSAAGNLVFTNNGVLASVGAGGSTNRQFTLNGNGGFLSSGTGPLTISYTGGVVGTGGTLILGGSNQGNNLFNPLIGAVNSGNNIFKTDSGKWLLGQSNSFAQLTSFGTGTLDIQGFNQSIGQVSLQNGSRIVGTGSIESNQTFDIQNGTITVTLAGAVGLTKAGTATQTGNLLGSNTYTGATNINQGTLAVTVLLDGSQPSGLGASGAGSNNLVLNTGTLAYIGTPNASTNRQFQINNNNAAIAASGTGTLTFTSPISTDTNGNTFVLTGTNTGSNSLASPLRNSGSFVKAGAGRWNYNASATYTGSGTISGGTLATTNIANGGFDVDFTTNGTNIATVSSTAGLAVGQSLANNGSIAPDTVITVVGIGTVQLSQAATGSGTGGTRVGFGNTLGLSTPSADHFNFATGTLLYNGTGASTDRLFSIASTGAISSSGSGPLSFTNTGDLGGAGTLLTLAGSNTGNNLMALRLTGAIAITKTGAGKWALAGSNDYNGITTVNGGTLELSNAASQAQILTNNKNTNLTAGRLVLPYAPTSSVAAVDSAVKASFLGTGSFVTGTGQFRATNGTGRALGVYDNGSAVIVAQTLFGDANIDGVVNALDFNAIASNFGAVTGKRWYQGDFTYDGLTNTLDFNALAVNFNSTFAVGADLPVGGDVALGLGSVVPEPASLGVLGTLAAFGLRRRRSAK